jgi:hypothetical protein
MSNAEHGRGKAATEFTDKDTEFSRNVIRVILCGFREFRG